MKLFKVILVFVTLCQYPNSYAQTTSQGKMSIGPTEEVLKPYKTLKNKRLLGNDFREFKIGKNKSIPVVVDNYCEINGKISINGRIVGSKESAFIIKLSKNSLYGYVVNPANDYGFEYTTNQSNIVHVEKVPSEKLVFICNLYDENPDQQENQKNRNLGGQHIGNIPDDLRKLQSSPKSSKVVYMDIREIMRGANPIYTSREVIYRTYQFLAASLSSFDVNVTTDHNVYARTPVVNSARARMHPSTGRSYAYINSFGTTIPSINYRKSNHKYYGHTLAHEVGHQLGLRHDGGGGYGEYHGGFSNYQWCPIMGSPYRSGAWRNPVYQFSKGEYNGASNRENDMLRIKRHLRTRIDDNPVSKSLSISNGNVLSSTNRGLIEKNSDKDIFTFHIGSSGGSVDLTISPLEYYTMLDITARIERADGTIVVQNNLSRNRSARLNTSLSVGSYKLIIEGGSEGSSAYGFSKFSSLGWYGISGRITGSTPTPVTSKPDYEPFLNTVLTNVNGAHGVIDFIVDIKEQSNSNSNLTYPVEFRIPANKYLTLNYSIGTTYLNGQFVNNINWRYKRERNLHKFIYVGNGGVFSANHTSKIGIQATFSPPSSSKGKLPLKVTMKWNSGGQENQKNDNATKYIHFMNTEL